MKMTVDELVGKSVAPLFKKHEVFTDSFIPPSFFFRDEEVKQIVENIASYEKHGITPDNMLITGPPSTGKTHILTMIVKAFNQRFETMESKVKLLYVNTRGNSYHQAMTALVSSAVPLVKKGKNTSEMLDALLDGYNGMQLGVIFDEVDKMISTNMYPNPVDSIVSDFTRLSETRVRFHGRCFIILISNKDVEKYISPPNRSSFVPNRIVFRSYNADEIARIMLDRCERGFKEEVISEEDVVWLAAKIYKTSKDLRIGFKTLLTAGKIAGNVGKRRIDRDIICKAMDMVEKDMLRELVTSTDDTQLILLYSVCSIQRDGEDVARNRNVYDLHCKMCDALGVDKVTHTHLFNQVCPRLESQGLMSSTVRSLGRGQGKERRLMCSDDVNEMYDIVCDEILHRFGVKIEELTVDKGAEVK